MKENKISRRSFLKFGAAASAVGMMAAAPVAANAAQLDADAAADEENCLLGLFQKPKYIFLFIGDGMGTAQIQSARFYKGTVDNNGAVTEADFHIFPDKVKPPRSGTAATAAGQGGFALSDAKDQLLISGKPSSLLVQWGQRTALMEISLWQ